MSAETIANKAFKQGTKALFDYDKHWASCFEPAPFLPMSRAEMDALGWDACDVIIVSGDAYVDHPSFGMAIIGRLLESQGFRVGIIAQPDWTSKDAFMTLGKPTIAWGVTAGNMDSMINRYTADRRIRSDDAYSPDNAPDKRPDRAAVVYSQRCREAYPDVPIILGGIEGSLRRIAHYDYWSDKVRRSILMDAKPDILVYGNGERAIIEIMHRLARGETIKTIVDVRGTAFILNKSNRHLKKDFIEINKTYIEYLDDIKEKEDNVRKLLNIIEDLIKDLLKYYGNDAELKEEIYSLMEEIDLLFKHYSFQEEQECRIVKYIELSSTKLQTDFSLNKIYINYPISVKENLKNIYLGKNIEQYLTYFKKELSGEVGTKLKIKVCEAPFK